MVTNALTIGETRSGPSGPVSPVKTPIINEPITFTARVPQGNVLCVVSAIHVDKLYLKALPIAPPIMTAVYSFTSWEL